MRMFNKAEMRCVVSDSEVLVMLVTLVDEGTARIISERFKII
jgi:hypothetical protein